MLPVFYVSITPTHTVTEHETAMANFALSCPLNSRALSDGHYRTDRRMTLLMNSSEVHLRFNKVTYREHSPSGVPDSAVCYL